MLFPFQLPGLRRSVGALCGLGLVGSVAFAQDESAELGVRAEPNLGGDAQLGEAESIRTRGTRLAQRLQAMLDEARREGDIIRVTCLNDKLTQANANVRTVSQRATSLRQALQIRDREAGNHHFTVLTVLSHKFDLLDQESSQCVGQSIFEPGASAEVTTTVEIGTPKEDAAVAPPPGPPPPFAISVPVPDSPDT